VFLLAIAVLAVVAPYADATVVLFKDLAGPQLAATPITLIIVVDNFVCKFKSVEYR
jgi:hypothetical protein